MRLIDADRVVMWLKHEFCEAEKCDLVVRKKNCELCRVGFAVALLTDAELSETVDAEPVYYGDWVDDGADGVYCTNCLTTWNVIDNCTETFKRCPNCGARMDGNTDG